MVVGKDSKQGTDRKDEVIYILTQKRVHDDDVQRQQEGLFKKDTGNRVT